MRNTSCLYCGKGDLKTPENGEPFCSSECKRKGKAGCNPPDAYARRCRSLNYLASKGVDLENNMGGIIHEAHRKRLVTDAQLARFEAGYSIPAQSTSPAKKRQPRAAGAIGEKQSLENTAKKCSQLDLSKRDGFWWVGDDLLGADTRSGLQFVRRQLSERGFNRLEVAAMIRGCAQ